MKRVIAAWRQGWLVFARFGLFMLVLGAFFAPLRLLPEWLDKDQNGAVSSSQGFNPVAAAFGSVLFSRATKFEPSPRKAGPESQTESF